MKKNVLKKALAVLVILAMMIPFMPVVALAEGEEPVATYKEWDKWDTDGDGIANEDGETAPATPADAYAWLQTNAYDSAKSVFVLDSDIDLAYFMICGTGTATGAPYDGNVLFTGETVTLGADITWNEGTASSTGFVTTDGSLPYRWVPYFSASGLYGAAMKGGFMGTFDGCGYTISGLYMEGERHQGFFACLAGVTVQNVNFENCYVKSTTTTPETFLTGMVCAAAANTNNFINIVVSDCHLTGPKNVGGVIGGATSGINYLSTKPNLTNCVVDAQSTVTGTAEATPYAGGLVGVLRGKNVATLTNCVSYATVTGSSIDSNGLIGYFGPTDGSVTITDCANAAGKYYYGTEGGKAIEFAAPVTGDMKTEVEGVMTKPNGADEFDARFVASIATGEGKIATTDTLIGFEYSLLSEYMAETAAQVTKCDEVYSSITSSFGGETLLATDYDANYLATLVITGIPATGSQTVLVRAYYKTGAGEAQYGNYAAVTFVNGEVAGSAYLTEYAPAE